MRRILFFLGLFGFTLYGISVGYALTIKDCSGASMWFPLYGSGASLFESCCNVEQVDLCGDQTFQNSYDLYATAKGTFCNSKERCTKVTISTEAYVDCTNSNNTTSSITYYKCVSDTSCTLEKPCFNKKAPDAGNSNGYCGGPSGLSSCAPGEQCTIASGVPVPSLKFNGAAYLGTKDSCTVRYNNTPEEMLVPAYCQQVVRCGSTAPSPPSDAKCDAAHDKKCGLNEKGSCPRGWWCENYRCTQTTAHPCDGMDDCNPTYDGADESSSSGESTCALGYECFYAKVGTIQKGACFRTGQHTDSRGPGAGGCIVPTGGTICISSYGGGGAGQCLPGEACVEKVRFDNKWCASWVAGAGSDFPPCCAKGAVGCGSGDLPCCNTAQQCWGDVGGTLKQNPTKGGRCLSDCPKKVGDSCDSSLTPSIACCNSQLVCDPTSKKCIDPNIPLEYCSNTNKYLKPGSPCSSASADNKPIGGNNACGMCASKGAPVCSNGLCKCPAANTSCAPQSGNCACTATGALCNADGTCVAGNCANETESCSASKPCCNSDLRCTYDTTTGDSSCKKVDFCGEVRRSGKNCNTAPSNCCPPATPSCDLATGNCVATTTPNPGDIPPGGICAEGLCCTGTGNFGKTCQGGICILAEKCLNIPEPLKPPSDDKVKEISIQKLFSTIAGVLYPVGIGIGLLFVVKAGYAFMTSEGDPQRVKAAQEELSSAIVGIMFILLSTAILNFIINLFIR